MMAKMFYNMNEAKAALGRSEEEVRQFAREGRLREFRDGSQLMFKVDQVDQLRAELEGGGPITGDQVPLSGADTGSGLGLMESGGGTASSSGIPLADSDLGARSPGVPLQDDTAMAADLGLSGSMGGSLSGSLGGSGGMPSPARPGGSLSGGSLSGGSLSGSGLGGSRGGINVLGDTGDQADPMAQTAMTPGVADSVNLEGVGSGSGLLDLTRESDDTSLGAELLDEIGPGRSRSGTAVPVESGVGTGVAMEAAAVSAGRRVGAAIAVEAYDPNSGLFGGLALGAATFVVLGAIVLAAAVAGTRPGLVGLLTGYGEQGASGLGILFGIGLAISLIGGVVGWVLGRSLR
jgi:hypothetical protein